MSISSSPPTDRQLRAAEEALLVHSDRGRAAGADETVIVDPQDGEGEYFVDIREHSCECKDFQYRVIPALRDRDDDAPEATKPCCKHLYRARWMRGVAPVPAAVVLEADIHHALEASLGDETTVKVIATPDTTDQMEVGV